ncbi:MAG: ATP-binding cassette domain-containing protein, partial [Nitrospiraceae bacterium]
MVPDLTPREQGKRPDEAVAKSRPNKEDSSIVLELRKVTCAYEEGRPAISDISLCARKGEILCLLGPSGCGKTTTLRAIAGFEPVVGGEVYLEGQLVSAAGL